MLFSICLFFINLSLVLLIKVLLIKKRVARNKTLSRLAKVRVPVYELNGCGFKSRSNHYSGMVKDAGGGSVVNVV